LNDKVMIVKASLDRFNWTGCVGEITGIGDPNEPEATVYDVALEFNGVPLLVCWFDESELDRIGEPEPIPEYEPDYYDLWLLNRSEAPFADRALDSLPDDFDWSEL
jgi:hypothetical protein